MATIIILRSDRACFSSVGADLVDSVGDGGTVVTTEMFVNVVTWPLEFEVVAVSVIVLVLAREEVEDVVNNVLVEEAPVEEEVVVDASGVELV
jgi:hypothetical protein